MIELFHHFTLCTVHNQLHNPLHNPLHISLHIPYCVMHNPLTIKFTINCTIAQPIARHFTLLHCPALTQLKLSLALAEMHFINYLYPPSQIPPLSNTSFSNTQIPIQILILRVVKCRGWRIYECNLDQIWLARTATWIFPPCPCPSSIISMSTMFLWPCPVLFKS